MIVNVPVIVAALVIGNDIVAVIDTVHDLDRSGARLRVLAATPRWFSHFAWPGA